MMLLVELGLKSQHFSRVVFESLHVCLHVMIVTSLDGD